ncbi:DUF805 domain-containing protein [Neisseria sp.]|uniref:DUF805 domain-containing protein n=1 Tax=Neisseria sp. TaxID=192066 RepID=UPI00359FCF36
MNWFLHSLKNIFNFRTRARRMEYGVFILVEAVLSGILGFILYALEETQTVSVQTVFWAALLVALPYTVIVRLASVSLTARRLHDMGRSGWWQLILLPLYVSWILSAVFAEEELGVLFPQAQWFFRAVVVIALVFAAVLLFTDGQRRTNRFGEDPKALSPHHPV